VEPDADTRRFQLTLHYDGSRFQGWQLQPEGRTVQGEIQAALLRLTGASRPVIASGRTDRGVHALGQVAAVTLPSRWEGSELRRALNAVLPADIWIESARVVLPSFHPRFDARGRSYRYQLGLHPSASSPFHRPWCWPLASDLDTELLRQGAALLLGERSFRAFAKAGQEKRGNRCRVSESAWIPWDGLGQAFLITADRFLHHMVRYLVGTMVEVARGRRMLSEMEELLTDPHTGLHTSPPAPPEGLFLTRVHYPDQDS
jgi:tRNA pseudouridine38-40 synthase